MKLRESPSGERFDGEPGDVLTCLGGDEWQAEPGGNVSGFTPRGTGAQFKTFFSTFTIANSISVGDQFFQQPSFNQLFVNDAATVITAIDDVLHTITFAGNATQTLVHQRLGVFSRPAMPNGTPT